MFLALVTSLVATLPVLVQGGQIPVINGVAGGVPSSDVSTSQLVSGSYAQTPLDAYHDAKPPYEALKGPRTPGKLRVVSENSGICETTEGVYQATGYGDLSSSESIWFWFFEARNDSDNAPLTLWLNGGPGSSSMIGLFQENGPCRMDNNSKSVSHNPYSWNEVSNVIFVDQPVGVGFSHGETKVGSALEGAFDLWKFFQIWFSDPRFSKYQHRDFALWTESYGGHYGPTFAAYFLHQNARIANGTISGIPIRLTSLGVGNGLTDPLLQYPQYIEYAASNPYHPLVTPSELTRAKNSFYTAGGCRDQITYCNNAGPDTVCSAAQKFCNENILGPLAGPYNPYYVLGPSADPYPPSPNPWLSSPEVITAIGAEALWTQSSPAVYSNFARTGDWMRSSSRYLHEVVDDASGVNVFIYAGDADYIVNYMGVEAMVDGLQTQYSEQYRAQEWANFTVASQVAGVYKNAGNFTYARFYGAGHEVPSYGYGTLEVGEAALEIFSQLLKGEKLHST